MKISFLMPTRGRPHNMRRFAKSCFETAKNPSDVQIMMYIDDDDTESYATAHDLADEYGCPCITFISGPRQYLSKCHNDLYTAEQNGIQFCLSDIVSFIGDDVIFLTKGWDEKIISAFDEFQDKIVFVYPDDGMNHEKLGVHGFLHRNWVDTLGYVVPPYFAARFSDAWIQEVAQNIGRAKYIPSVIIEHLHYCVNKGNIDKTYKEANQRDANMGQVWYGTLPQRIEDAQKLLRRIGGIQLSSYTRIL